MKDKATQIIKVELAEQGLNFVELAKLMKDKGYKESPDTIRSKLHRGTFSFAFALEVLDTLGLSFTVLDKE